MLRLNGRGVGMRGGIEVVVVVGCMVVSIVVSMMVSMVVIL